MIKLRCLTSFSRLHCCLCVQPRFRCFLVPWAPLTDAVMVLHLTDSPDISGWSVGMVFGIVGSICDMLSISIDYSFLHFLKGSSDAKFSFTCCLDINVFNVHNQLIKIKTHRVFFTLINHDSFLKSSRSQSLVSVTSHKQAHPTTVDWHWRLTLAPPWVSCHQSSIVSTPEQM